MSLSIIIPSFNNVEFLDELFDSIKKNNTDTSFEVLFGIDNCELTKEYIEQNTFPDNFYFFYFTENVGPYKIKNTLAKISRYDNLFFFDSDDIMLEDCISVINDDLFKFECVKPKFANFNHNDKLRNLDESNKLYGEGVFGIRKSIFLGMNGFEGWRCAADSDFMGRLYKKKLKLNFPNKVLFHRRIHSSSLTMSKETGYASRLRGKYFGLSKKKNPYEPLDELSMTEYVVMESKNTHWSEKLSEEQQRFVELEKERKLKTQNLLSGVLNGGGRQVKVKDPITINYNKINQHQIPKTNATINNALKKVKLENIVKNFGRR